MKDVGVALFGRMRGDQAAPRRVCLDHEPCDECKKLMEQGIILISVKDSDVGSDNPYRTGGWVVVKDEAIKRALKGDAGKGILASRIAFVPDLIWDAMGLPRGEHEAEKDPAVSKRGVRLLRVPGPR
jgi:hypothetical protein